MTAEQAALLEKARLSLRAAKGLAEDGLHDFAASRAYYAMFYVAEAFLWGEGLSFSKHSGVISHFGQRFAKTGRLPARLHRYLIEAQVDRNKGDYDFVGGVTHERAREQIARAAEFLEVAEQHLGPEPGDDQSP